MDTRHSRSPFKFHLRYSPYADTTIRGEWLWGRWLDKRAGLALSGNNGNQVPLAVNDVLRVRRDSDGNWRAVELVRVTESIVTFTSFETPLSDQRAMAAYDRWRESGYALHTEGIHGLYTTAWREFLGMQELLGYVTPDLAQPGWTLWQAFGPEERRAEIEKCAQFRRRVA